MTATLVSVPPRSIPLAEADLAELLAALRWSPDDLDPALPPRVAYAGAWHPVIAATSRDRLADLDYDMTALSALMSRAGLDHRRPGLAGVTDRVPARNPFPPAASSRTRPPAPRPPRSGATCASSNSCRSRRR